MATVNIYENLKSPTVQDNITIEDWFDMIKNSEHSELILRARTGKVNYDKTKEILPCVTYNFTFDCYKKNNYVIDSTGLMYIDIDNPSFDINTIDKSKVFAYYRSFGGSGYAIIVKVAGVTMDNFKPTYLSVCTDLNLSKYVDNSAVKPTQFNALSYDENIFINNDCYVFTSELNDTENVPVSIVIGREKKAYTIDTGTKIRTQIRFNNLDEIQMYDNYVVNWDGYDFINCWIPMKKRERNQRNTFLLSYLNNFIWLNQGLSKEKITEVMVNVNEVALVEPYPKWKIGNMVDSILRYLEEGTLKPIYNRKKRKIVFNQQVKLSKEEKLDIVRNELAIMRTDKSISKLIEIINNWDFNENGKLSVRSIAEVGGMNKKTVAKYYHLFKLEIETMNFEFKNYRKVTSKVKTGAEDIDMGAEHTDVGADLIEAQIQDEMENEYEYQDEKFQVH